MKNKETILSHLEYWFSERVKIKIVLKNKSSFYGSIGGVGKDYIILVDDKDKEMRLFPLDSILYYVGVGK